MKPLHYAKQIAYSSWDVLLFTYDMATNYSGTYGNCYVECGVAAGAQLIAMRYGALQKKIYALDSYSGIPLCSNRDNQMPGIAFLSPTEQKALPDPGKQVLESSGATVVPLEHVKKHIIDSGLDLYNINFVEGWFEETVDPLSKTIEPIALLRLDGDLYNSTWVCLQHLFPKVIKGGCVIVDDWTLPGCQAACKEYFELIGYEPDYKFLDGTAYFFK